MNPVIINNLMSLIPLVETENPKTDHEFDMLFENLLGEENEKDEKVEISIPMICNNLENVPDIKPAEENKVNLQPDKTKTEVLEVATQPLKSGKTIIAQPLETEKDITIKPLKTINKTFRLDKKTIEEIKNIVTKDMETKVLVNKKELVEAFGKILDPDNPQIHKKETPEQIKTFLKEKQINIEEEKPYLKIPKEQEKPIAMENKSQSTDPDFSRDVEKEQSQVKAPVFEFNIQADINENPKIPVVEKSRMTEVVENKIIGHLNFVKTEGSEEFEVQLRPEFLGKITIKLEKSTEGVKVKVSTSNLEVKETLSSHITQITDNLKAQGVDLQNAEIIYTGFTNQDSNFNNENRYKGNTKKSLTHAKGEYEKAVISVVAGTQNEQVNLNGNLNYLV